MSWGWIALSMVAPMPLALVIARLIWRRSVDAMMGNIAATTVVLATAVIFMGHEYVEIQRCAETPTVACRDSVDTFSRLAPYAFAGFIDVGVIFTLGLRFEEKRRRRGYAPEWQ